MCLLCSLVGTMMTQCKLICQLQAYPPTLSISLDEIYLETFLGSKKSNIWRLRTIFSSYEITLLFTTS